MNKKNLHWILQIQRICRSKKSLRRAGLMLPFLCLLLAAAKGQSGYIYVHSKTLNEADSPDITYSITGGSTAAPGFVLNDKPAQTIIDDMGASQNGRLWAVSRAHELYYRDALSSNWIKTSVTGVARVDGGPNGTCFYINTDGIVFSYTGSGSPTQISASGQFCDGCADIGSGWTATPYVVNTDANVYKYSGAGTVWDTYATGSEYGFYKIDVNPSNGDVYVADIANTTSEIWKITPALAISNLGNPGAEYDSYYRDLAVNENGEIYVTAHNLSAPFGWYVHKFSSGTTWVRELGSFDGNSMTGGVGNSLWVTMDSGGQNNNSGSDSYPFNDIFSRGFDGSEATYIDDERVRTSPVAGNSQLIPVAPGTYTITETVPGNWDLQKITVYDPSANSSVDLGTRSAIVTVEADEVVNVVFQTGEVNPFNMTTDCANAYLETFGAGAVGSYGQPVDGQTTYHYLAGNVPGEDGYYKIVNRANPDFNGWSDAAGITDHTSTDGTGYMYAVNAGFDKGEFFRRRFTGVIAGANYSFSAWIVNLTATAPVNPNVSFTVYDHATQAVLGTYSTGELTDDPSTWQKYGFSFTGTSSDVDLVISNNGFGGNGNDLALDDISFSLSPPDPTITIKNGSCPDGLGSIEVTSPLGAEYEYSKDGVTWQSAPLFDNLVSGSYTVSVRFTGTTNCTNSTTIAKVNPSICGNVFHDAEGLTDGNVNGTGIGTGSAPLYVSLYNGVTLVNTVPVNADGTYTFSDVPANATYTVVLGTDPITNPSSPFPGNGNGGWVSTGEDCCDAMGSDVSVDGAITIVLGSSSVANANFGIELHPESDDHTTTIPQPAANDVLTLNGIGTNPPLLSGSDPEDGTYSGVSGTITAPTGVIITSLLANGVLNYNGNPVAVGDTIADPALLTIVLSGTGYTSVSFNYAYVDAAKVDDPTPAIYTISWTTPLPVTLVNFDVTASESQVRISWTTSSETNSSYFDIERSPDVKTWTKVGEKAAAGENSDIKNYSFTDGTPLAGINYYRLKMVDQDATFAYSKIVSVQFAESSKPAFIYPNPSSGVINLGGIDLSKVVSVEVKDFSGNVVSRHAAPVSASGINIKNLPAGIYMVRITETGGTIHTNKVVILK